MLLQLDFNFNIKALEALVTLEVVDFAIIEVEEEVATRQKEATNEGKVVDKEKAAWKVTTKRTSGTKVVAIKVVEVLEEEEAT